MKIWRKGIACSFFIAFRVMVYFVCKFCILFFSTFNLFFLFLLYKLKKSRNWRNWQWFLKLLRIIKLKVSILLHIIAGCLEYDFIMLNLMIELVVNVHSVLSHWEVWIRVSLFGDTIQVTIRMVVNVNAVPYVTEVFLSCSNLLCAVTFIKQKPQQFWWGIPLKSKNCAMLQFFAVIKFCYVHSGASNC